MSYTATTNSTQLPTIADIERAKEAMEKLSLGTDWILVSPDGHMYKGDVQRLFMILAQHHPLLKMGSLNGK